MWACSLGVVIVVSGPPRGASPYRSKPPDDPLLMCNKKTPLVGREDAGHTGRCPQHNFRSLALLTATGVCAASCCREMEDEELAEVVFDDKKTTSVEMDEETNSSAMIREQSTATDPQ